MPREVKMHSQVRVLFEEFPFLNKYFNPRKIEKARVQRVDAETMEISTVASGTRIYKVLLLDKIGDLVVELDVKKIYGPRWQFWRKRTEKLWGESVSDALLRSGNPSLVQYVIVETPNKELVLYKPPRSFTLQGWIDEQRRKLKEALAEIDKV
jgi:hypothetical protein